MGTDEHLILASASAHVGSTGRWFRVTLTAAHDATSSTTKLEHTAEGEDTAEQRVTGFAARHQASSGTPNVTLWGMEEAANGNHTDGGAYLIALPTSLFADFQHTWTGSPIAVDGTETTVGTISSYAPTTNGNHLIIGAANGNDTPTNLGGLWVEEGTTEIRTGDAHPETHNQIWDNAKDHEVANTFQRYSISSTVTLNLQSQADGVNFDVENRTLIVVNLNEAAVGPPTFPPFRRRQETVRRL